MKLCICIVHNRDKNRIIDALIEAGFKFTIIASTGGFLREGNTTLMIGCEEDQLESLQSVIQDECSARDQIINVAPFDSTQSGGFLASPVKVPVGGAVVMILDMEQFCRY